MQTQNGDWYGGYMDMDTIIWSETKLKKKHLQIQSISLESGTSESISKDKIRYHRSSRFMW